MKTSLKKLRGFAGAKHERQDRRQKQSLAFIELDQGSQDMVDLKECYDRLFSVAAETANSVYEFSESLGEMGDCLLEKTALNDDEESGKVLLMLGKVQLELQKFVDDYRSNIFKTITIPSESLLNELRVVEEMKKRCDYKREIYEDLLSNGEKGKLKGSRGVFFASQQFQIAQDEYEEEVNAFIFRMKSLKQGQSRSLITQAARHHAAQLSFFKKALKSLEEIEPHVRMVAEELHIDYQFSGLEDDQGDVNDDGNDEDDGTEDDSGSHDDGELSIDRGLISGVQEVSTSKTSMEVDNVDGISPVITTSGTAAKESSESSSGRQSFGLRREMMMISQSAPLFRQKKLDQAGQPRQMQPSPSRRFASYVLPTPVEANSLGSGKADAEISQQKQVDHNLWHSSPLGQTKSERPTRNDKFSGPIILDAQQVLKESNNNTMPTGLLPSLTEELAKKNVDPNVVYTRRVKRQAFSGPITGKPWSKNPNLSASGRMSTSEYPLPFSGSILRTPFPRPTVLPAPIISELHELPRPPAHLASSRPSNRGAHSMPLAPKGRGLPAATLPKPPQSISRSYSIPSGGQKDSDLLVPSEASQNEKRSEGISSPPLTTIRTPDVQEAAT